MKIQAIENTRLLAISEILAAQSAKFSLAANKAEVFEFTSSKGKQMSFASAPVRCEQETLDISGAKVSHANIAMPNSSTQSFFRELEEGDIFTCDVAIDKAGSDTNKSTFDRNTFSNFAKAGN